MRFSQGRSLQVAAWSRDARCSAAPTNTRYGGECLTKSLEVESPLGKCVCAPFIINEGELVADGG